MSPLIGYGVLFAGAGWFGVFSQLSAQLGILALVVVVAAGLLAATRVADARVKQLRGREDVAPGPFPTPVRKP